jgi:protein tyrosine/serine phosphatase
MAQTKAQPRPKNTADKAKGESTTEGTRKKVDWDAVERDYRTGKFTLRELEAKHGVDNAQIARRKKKDGWTQDLSSAVRQATNAMLMTEIVSKEVSDAQQSISKTVIAAAEVNKQVVLGHRTNLKRITAVAGALMAQIEQAALQMPDLAEAIEIVRNPDENGMDRANDALRKAMARPALVDDLKKLAEINERVIKGERQAFGLDEGQGDQDDQAAPSKSLTDAERAVRLFGLLTKGAK